MKKVKFRSNGTQFDSMVTLFEESLKSIEASVIDLEEISEEMNDIAGRGYFLKDSNQRLVEDMVDDYKDAHDDLLSIMKDLKRNIFDSMDNLQEDVGIDSSDYNLR